MGDRNIKRRENTPRKRPRLLPAHLQTQTPSNQDPATPLKTPPETPEKQEDNVNISFNLDIEFSSDSDDNPSDNEMPFNITFCTVDQMLYYGITGGSMGIPTIRKLSEIAQLRKLCADHKRLQKPLPQITCQ